MGNDKALISLQDWQVIKEVAPAMTASRLFGVQSPEQAAAIMLKGFELGLGLSASFEFIQVIQGKPALSPRGALALIQSSPDFAGMKIEDIADSDGQPDKCRVWMKRRNGFEYTAEFSMADAKRASLVKAGGGWTNYPANMLRWRAVGYCADVVFPDVVGGMKRADEMGADLTPMGDTVIEGEVRRIASEPPPESKSEVPKVEGSNGNGNSNTPPRPFAPDVVRKGIQDRAAPNTRPAPEASKRQVVISLTKVAVGGDEARHTLTRYLIGKEHSEEFTAGECNALIAWVGATKVNDWQPNGYAIEEAKAILALVAAEAGVQLELPAEVEAAFAEATGADYYVEGEQDPITQ